MPFQNAVFVCEWQVAWVVCECMSYSAGETDGGAARRQLTWVPLKIV